MSSSEKELDDIFGMFDETKDKGKETEVSAEKKTDETPEGVPLDESIVSEIRKLVPDKSVDEILELITGEQLLTPDRVEAAKIVLEKFKAEAGTKVETSTGIQEKKIVTKAPEDIDSLFGDPIQDTTKKVVEKAIDEKKVIEKSAEETVEDILNAGAGVKTIQPMRTTPDTVGDVQEATDSGAIGYMFYALKGGSKTTLALSFIHENKTTTISALSFDRQTLPIKDELFAGVYYEDSGNIDEDGAPILIRKVKFPDIDRRIKVYDAILHFDRSSAERILESADATYRYINKILDKVESNRPDYIVLDGTEILQFIAEQTMRYRNNLMPYQGIKNFNLWKARKQFINQVFLRSLGIAKKGVICTAYVKAPYDASETGVIELGTLQIKAETPKWVGAIMTDTRVVIRTYSTMHKTEGMRFYAVVDSSKTGKIKTGLRVNITGNDEVGYHCIEKIWEASTKK